MAGPCDVLEPRLEELRKAREQSIACEFVADTQKVEGAQDAACQQPAVFAKETPEVVHAATVSSSGSSSWSKRAAKGLRIS
jgi:hypothetical protein